MNDLKAALAAYAKGYHEALGTVTVGDKTYPNSWAEGKAYRLILCQNCADTGRLYDDDGKYEGVCDCRAGDAQWESGESA